MFQRKTATDIVKYVSGEDQAIAPESDHNKYIESGFDDQYVRPIDGGTLTRFHLKPLAPNAFRAALSAPSDALRHFDLVACSLTHVENWRPGESIPVKVKTIAGIARADSRQLDEIYDPVLFAELANVVVAISRIHPLSRSGSE